MGDFKMLHNVNNGHYFNLIAITLMQSSQSRFSDGYCNKI